MDNSKGSSNYKKFIKSFSDLYLKICPILIAVLSGILINIFTNGLTGLENPFTLEKMPFFLLYAMFFMIISLMITGLFFIVSVFILGSFLYFSGVLSNWLAKKISLVAVMILCLAGVVLGFKLIQKYRFDSLIGFIATMLVLMCASPLAFLGNNKVRKNIATPSYIG